MTGISTIDDLGRVGHACLVPDSEDHLWEATAAFVAGGLAAGERVVYFENDTADVLLGRLADDRVPVAGALADGGLVIVPTQRTRQVCAFPVADIVELMRQTIVRIRERRVAGHPARGRVPRAAADRRAAQARRVRDGRRRPPGRAPERRYALPVRPALLRRRGRGRDARDPPHRAGHTRALRRHPAARHRVGGHRAPVRGRDRPVQPAAGPARCWRPRSTPRCAPPTPPPTSRSTWRRCASSTSRVRSSSSTPRRRSPRRTGWCSSAPAPACHRVLDRCGAPFAAQLEVVPREEVR